MSYHQKRKGDLYWCTEGCFPVEADHCCEQWSQTYRIPEDVVKAIRAGKKK